MPEKWTYGNTSPYVHMLLWIFFQFCFWNYLGLVGVSLWRPWWAGAPPLEPTHDRMVGRVHCPTWSLDLFLLQGLPSETRWLPGQRSVGGARPELIRYHLF